MNQLRNSFQITNQPFHIVKNFFLTFARSTFIFWMMLGLLSSPGYAETIKVGGSGSAIGPMRLIAKEFMKSNPNTNVIVLPSLGSSGGVRAVLAGAIEIALTARPPKKRELEKGAVGIEYGRSPFVIATGMNNNAASITTSQLVDIYSGKITTWPDGSRIRLIVRPVNEPDTEILNSFSPEMRQAVKKVYKRKGMKIGKTTQDASQLVENIPGALGTSVLSTILSEKRRMKPLSLNGVKPTPKAISDGTYLYFKRYFMVTAPKEVSSLARRFISFVRSAAGSEILTQTGHWVGGGKSWVAQGNKARENY